MQQTKTHQTTFLPFKQGVALSCVIFILCIDPLIRNLNSDPEVGIVEIKTRLGNESIGYKAGAYADDIDVIVASVLV